MSLFHQYLACVALFIVLPGLYLIDFKHMKNSKYPIEPFLALLGFVIFCIGGLLHIDFVTNLAGFFCAFFGALTLLRIRRNNNGLF